MDNLHKLQETLAHSLNYPQAANAELQLAINNASPLAVHQRLAIYRNSFIVALVKTLGDTYTVCKKIVGEEFFQAMGHIYIQQTPSRSANIHNYGESLATFIQGFPAAQTLPYLASVAELEWALHIAGQVENKQRLNVDSLSHISEANYEKVVFKLLPGSALITSDYPIHSIWEFNQKSNEDETIDLTIDGVKLLVYPDLIGPQMTVLTELEWQMLSGIQAGLTIAQLGDNLEEKEQQPFIQALAGFMHKGWLVDFSLPFETALRGPPQGERTRVKANPFTP
jgi:hypothetical protein